MLSVESLLGIIATEVLEGDINENPSTAYDLPPIKFNLELIENPDGTYTWVED